MKKTLDPVTVLGVATVLVTFVLLLLGGVVHASESSLACPDWPLCYGEVLPKMEGKVAIEHSHRLLATLVGLLTIGLVVLSFRRRPVEPTLRRLAIASLGVVVFQGLLGGLTVILRLPTLISTAHLGTSLIFFGLLIALTVVAAGRRDGVRCRADLVDWQAISLSLVYLQVVVGALVRHTGSGLACNTKILTCGGELWPASAPARLHVGHRAFAVLVAVVLVVTAVRIARSAPESARLAWAGVALVVAQITLGVLTVTSFIAIPVVTAHLGGAALLIGQQLVLLLVLRREDTSQGLGVALPVDGLVEVGS